jgi:hypothetical protein
MPDRRSPMHWNEGSERYVCDLCGGDVDAEPNDPARCGCDDVPAEEPEEATP